VSIARVQQSYVRRRIARKRFRHVIKCAVKIQAHWRRAIQHWHYGLRLKYLEEDLCVRVRHVAAMRIQTAFRRYFAQCLYRAVLDTRDKAYK
jgi:hypothetical protein